MPGFIDTHIHAPQYPNTGLGLGEPLLEWLKNYTYPMEAKFNNNSMAKDMYCKAVVCTLIFFSKCKKTSSFIIYLSPKLKFKKRTLSYGTTTASYFATIHLEASIILCDILGLNAISVICLSYFQYI